MKKTIILLLLIAVFSLTGCERELDDKKQEIDSVQPDSKTQAEFIFNKNRECLKYKKEIEEKLNNKNSPFGETSLEQIFYSPKINSCLYVEYGDQDEYYNRRLFDIRDDGPSSNPLEACLLAQYPYGCEEFDNKLEEYK